MKLLEKIKINKERELNFFDIPLIHYGTRNSDNFSEKYVDLFPKSFIYQFLDRILEQIGDEYDLVCLVRTAGIGEAYIYNFIFDEVVQKYNAKNPCIVTHRQAYKDMYDLYLKVIPVFVTTDSIPVRDYHNYLYKRVIRYKNKNFIVIHSTIKESGEVFKKYSQGYKKPYPIVIKEMAGVKVFHDNYPKFSADDKNVVNLVKNLNFDKFIFINPEANAVLRLSDEYFEKIISALNDKGYDVYANTVDGKYKNCVSASITLPQSMYLASLSKGIISLRCGFLEFLSTLNVPKHILYTHHRFSDVTIEQFIQSTSIKDYPMVDKNTVFEYNTETLSLDEIINKITEKL